MNRYSNHQQACDLCDETFDVRLEGTTTECGTVVCETCCDEGAVYWIFDDSTGEDYARLA